MKYIDWLKRQIKLTRFKNVIRFPIEKRLNQIEEEKFLNQLANNTPNSEQFDKKKQTLYLVVDLNPRHNIQQAKKSHNHWVFWSALYIGLFWPQVDAIQIHAILNYDFGKK